MRILANYGYKDNGDTYSVTFETVGDVAKENADAVVDELFRMAKAELSSASLTLRLTLWNSHQKKKLPFLSLREMAIPIKPQLKDPSAPATRKQKSLIARLAKEKGRFIEGLNSLTMQEASETIDELMAV